MMRRCLCVACESPNGSSQLQTLQTSSAAMSTLARGLTAPTPRSSGSISIAKAGHAQTVGGEPRSAAIVSLVACGASASHASRSELVNDTTPDLHDNKMCSAKPTAVANAGASDSPDPFLSDFLLDQFQFHRAPTGMADRISAASDRYASRQRCQKHSGQHQPQQFLQAQPRSTPGLPHDPESSRFWEARLLSRACQSLAFHISSHFHVPAGALDPLASVLSSSVPSHNGTPTAAAAATPIISSLPPPPMTMPQPHTGSAVITYAAALQGQHGDLYGLYDNLAAVYALKTVAGALIDPALWRSGTASGVSPPPNMAHAQNRTSDYSNRLNPQHLPNCRNQGSKPAPEPAPEPALQSPQSEAPSAVNALIHVVSAALLRLSHTCGHPGCYSILEPPAAVMAAVASGASAARLPGVPFAGRQLARLYDMAYASCAVDAGALAGVPASTAAAVLLLLAAAQPPQHPAVRKAALQGLSPGAAATCGGGGKPSVPAALLARYLRVGSRAHNPLDTVRVMWALLRLQMPDAGSLLQPAEFDGDSSSSGGNEGGPATGPPQQQQQQQQPDPMRHLGRILFRQLQNRDRALAALRGARPGELYGTWQLAVQVTVLIRDRALVRQHSEAALAQLDSALALLEATLTEPGSRSISPSGSESKSGSESGSAPAAPLDPRQKQQNHVQASTEKVGGSSGVVQGRRSDAEATAPATAVHDSWVTAVVSLQDFLELCKEAGTGREAAADSAAAAVDGAGGGGRPAWDVLPWSDAEWQSVLGDTEQRAAVLLSTWPELGRLVEQLPQGQNHEGNETAEKRGPKWGGAVSMPRGTATAAAVVAADAVQKQQQQRRLRIHMQSYSALHFCTLELLYRAVKAQAPDATLLTPLSPPEADATSATTRSQRILSAVALPYSAAVDMVFTDVSGRRVGLCLAHLGASRRAPGEIAVLQYALVGWPEADVAAAQQRFRTARAAATVAAAHAQARAARTAAATAAASSAFAIVGAAAAAAAVAVASQSGDASDAAMPWSLNMAAPRYCTAAAAVAADADADATASSEASHEGVTDRCKHQLEMGVGNGGREVDLTDEEYSGLEERALAEAAAAALEADAAAVTAAAATGIVVTPATPQVSNLDLDDVIALELDHDWFHLRESYYDAVRRQNKWDPDVRQAISMAMSYMELPWEAQLDMVWHALAAAGVELPIRVFA